MVQKMKPFSHSKTADVFSTVSHQARKSGDVSVDMGDNIMKVFSSGIYRFKKAAVVRELMSNAYDSHLLAGKVSTPFKVKAPSPDGFPTDTIFAVEDFGVGMSLDDIINVFVIKGRSTKSGANLGIGGYGVGALSIFAYTNQFSVRGRKGGKETLVMLYEKAEGVFSYDVVHTGNTNEPDGVRIEIDIKDNDIRSFQDEIGFFASFYEVRPEITGGSVEMFFKEYPFKDKRKYAIANPDAFDSIAEMGGSNVYVMMGPVPYPVTANFVKNSISDIPGVNYLLVDSAFSTSNGDVLLIKASIGSLGLPISREGIATDQKTTSRLKKIIRATALSFGTEVMREINSGSSRSWLCNTLNKYDRYVAFCFSKQFAPDRHRACFEDEPGILNIHRATASSGRKNVSMEGVLGEAPLCSMDRVVSNALNKSCGPLIVGPCPTETGVINLLVCPERSTRKSLEVLNKTGCTHVYTSNNVSDTRKARLEAVLGVKVNFIDYAEEKKKMGLTPKPRVRSKLSETVVSAKKIVIDLENEVIESPSRVWGTEYEMPKVEKVDLEAINSSSGVMALRASIGSGCVLSPRNGTTGSEPSFIRKPTPLSDISFLLKVIRKSDVALNVRKIVIIDENSRTSRRLVANGVKDLHEFLDEVMAPVSDDLTYAIKTSNELSAANSNNAIKLVMIGCLPGEGLRWMVGELLAIENKRKHYEAALARLEARGIIFVEYNYHQACSTAYEVATDFAYERYKEVTNMAASIYASVVTRYPMIDRVITILREDSSTSTQEFLPSQEIVDYVEMVNEKFFNES